MLLKSVIVSLGIGLFLTTAAFGQTTVQTGAAEATIGAEVRVEYIRDDQGIQKTSDFDPAARDTINFQEANINLSGKISKMTEFFLKFGLLGESGNSYSHPGVLEEGWVKHWFTDMFALSIGKQLVHQGGWDNVMVDYKKHAWGKYRDNFPLGDAGGYSNAIQLHVKVAGEISVQIVNDVTNKDNPSNARGWNDRAKPTWILGWHGEFGPIMPLVHIGSYDNDKSKFYEVGIRGMMSGVDFYLDYLVNNRSKKYNETKANGDAESKGVDDVMSTINVSVGYEVKNVVTPRLYYSTFEVKQGEDDDLGLEDQEFNSTNDEDQIYGWDDNGSTLGVSFDLTMLDNGFTPYLAYEMHSGDFEDDEKAGEAKSRSQSLVKVGVLGNF